ERQIGQAILLYSNDNKGKYPPDLGTLLLTQDITAQVFVCPSSSNEVPSEVKTVNDAAKWANDNSNYVYLGAALNNNTAGPETVVLYEKDDDHDGDGMNLLFGDGHVEWANLASAKQLIAKAQKK